MSERIKVFSEEEYEAEMSRVEADYSACQKSASFCSYDGKELVYYSFLTENPTATVVISHGFTEFAEKYTELSYYLTQANMNVYVLEARGHGHSYREVDNLQLTHIDSFSVYVDDLEFFIKNVVINENNSLPIYLIGHSMGSTIAALYLAEKKSIIQKAVLVSPMVSICPKHLPEFVFTSYLKHSAKKKGLKSVFIYYSRPFDPKASLNESADSSYARFSHNLKKRTNDPYYQNSIPSIGWMQGAALAHKRMMVSCKSISADVLILCGDRDTVVRQKPQETLARLIPHCTFIRYSDAKHAMFCASSNQVEQTLNDIIQFLKRPGQVKV